jgi:hypothetical protein
MLKRLFEWYRVVNPNPNDETLEKRKASALALLEHLTKASDYDLLFPCIAGIANGFDSKLHQDSEIVKLAVEAIREHQPAFPQDLSENALELRMLCATTIGEILSLRLQKGIGSDTSSALIASLITSALSIRPLPAEKHLNAVLKELGGLAKDVSERDSLERRNRPGFSFENFNKVQTTALAAFWTALLPEIQNCVQHLQQQADVDREELDVLWWMYTGISLTTESAIDDLEPGAISLCCGAELANLVVTPPTRSSRQMVSRVIRDHRKKNTAPQISLKQLAADWKPELWALLTPNEGKLKTMIQTYPVLFPLSWICIRLHESQGTSVWGEELNKKTGIPEKRELSFEDWGIQVFNERITQRTYVKILEA